MLRTRSLPAVLFVPLWSTGFIVARLVAPHAEPLTFLALRFAAAAAVLAGVAGLRRTPWPRGRAALRSLLAGVLIHGIYLGALFWAVAGGLPAGIAALVGGLQPLLTALLAGPLLGERVSGRRWAGILVGALGAGLVLAPKLGAAGAGAIAPLPLAAAVLGMTSLTLGALYQKSRGPIGHLTTDAALQYCAATLAALVGMAAIGAPRFDVSAPAAWIGLGWAVFGLSIGAIGLLLVLIRRGAAAEVASLFYLVPGVSALMAYALFGEALTPMQIGGLVIAAAGVMLASARSSS